MTDYAIVADLGGTNGRFALVKKDLRNFVILKNTPLRNLIPLE